MKIRINFTINRAVQILLLYLFVVNVAESFLIPLFAIFVKDFIVGASLRTAGFSLAFYGFAKSIVQVPLARFLDRRDGEYDEFYALLIGAFISAIYPFLLLTISEVWQLYALEVFAGIGSAFLMGSYYSLFARHVDAGSEGFEWNLFSVGGLTVSTAVGTAIGGMIADAYGFRTLLFLNGFLNSATFFLLVGLYPFLKEHTRAASFPQISK